MTQFNENFRGSFPYSNQCMQAILAADTALSFTVPGDDTMIYRAKFSCSSTAEVWVGFNATPTDPTAGTARSDANVEFIPLNECRYVKGGDVLKFLSHTTPRIGLALLRVLPQG